MIITICGSMKKRKLMALITHRLMQIEDMIVFEPSMYLYIIGKENGDELSSTELNNLVKVHRKKIDMSDVVIIIDYNMGQDTWNEKLYAEKHDKAVIMFSEIIRFFQKDEEVMNLLKGE